MKNTSIKIITVACILLFCLTSLAPVQATPTIQKNIQPTAELFDQKISFLMRLAGFSALSTCLIQDDQIIWSNGYGYYDRDNHTPAVPTTIYVLASVTKTIVGTALMQLYDLGLFDLEDDVNTILPFELRNPNFPDDPITVRMLLSHTSSLNTNNQAQYYWMNFSGDPPFSFFPEPYLQEFLLPGGRFYDDTVWSDKYRPGEQAMYANIGFDIISYLVELLSGEPFLDYCDTHLFAPLEMYNTSFNLSRLDIDQVAIPYQRYRGRYYQIDELMFLFGDDTPPEKYWRIRCYPAGGLYSTVEDLAHFLIAHMNQGLYKDFQLLQPDTVTLMHTIAADNEIGYGLAWMQFNIGSRLTTTGHGGDLPGADTWMLYNETQDRGVIYFANGNAAYSRVPLRGFLLVQLILYSLYTKQDSFTEKTSAGPLVFPRPALRPQQLLG